MRATTLTSMTALALLWQPQLCAAQGKPTDSGNHASVKPDGGAPKKKSAGRLGSLSPDEARRAARARARATAALKKAEPVRAVASTSANSTVSTKSSAPTKTAESAKGADTAKKIETAATREVVKVEPKEADATDRVDTAKAAHIDKTAKATDTAQATQSAKTLDKAKTPDTVASKPTAQPDKVATKSPQPDGADAPATGRSSATVGMDATDTQPSARAVRMAEHKRKAARREARRRTRERFAEDQYQAPVSPRYWRVGPGQVDGYGYRYEQRVVIAPQAQWRYVQEPAYPPTYPSYPYVGY